MVNGREKPINYGEWSKSLEVARTFTPNFVARDDGRTEENKESEGGPKRQRVVMSESRAATSGSPGASAP